MNIFLCRGLLNHAPFEVFVTFIMAHGEVIVGIDLRRQREKKQSEPIHVISWSSKAQ
jgi:hypothetical protein